MSFNAKEESNSSRLIRLPQVLDMIPVSKSTWWQGVKEGRYPKPVKLGPKTTAWLEIEVKELVARLSFNRLCADWNSHGRNIQEYRKKQRRLSCRKTKKCWVHSDWFRGLPHLLKFPTPTDYFVSNQKYPKFYVIYQNVRPDLTWSVITFL